MTKDTAQQRAPILWPEGTKTVKLSKFKVNPDNPRFIRDEKFEKLVKSVLSFPKMLSKRPVTYLSDTGMIIGGTMRFRAFQAIGWKDVPAEWFQDADEFTEDEIKEFIIKDNVGFGEWDWEALANTYDQNDLEDWGLDVPVPAMDGQDGDGGEGLKISKAEARQKLAERFVVPPFSILDTRQGYWQERKAHWHVLIEDNGESRENTLSTAKSRMPRYYDFKRAAEEKEGRKMSNKEFEDTYFDECYKDSKKSILNNVSLLDPVLSELICVWFGLPGGAVCDPFAGDSVFGYVAASNGLTFTGIELRKEQAALNNTRTDGMTARYICDDGRNVAKHLAEKSQDLIFSCPPYFDLEVYSDLPEDASNQKEYADSLKIIDDAFTGAARCLRDDRFAVIVVGDIRDSANGGTYRRYVDHVKDIFCKNGFSVYNELILVEIIGSAGMRAAGQMKSRKVVKVHQNVLVFFKGDAKKIKDIYPAIEIDEALLSVEANQGTGPELE